jgi:hypothetical protein
MKECTKPNCNCIEAAEKEAGGHVKNYPCLAGGKPSSFNHDYVGEKIIAYVEGQLKIMEAYLMLNSEQSVQVSDTTEAQ